MTDINVRSARTTDAGRTGAILSGFIDDTPWMPRIHSRAQDIGFTADMIDRGWVTVVECNGRVQGFAARDGDRVHALYVDMQERRRGLGRLLLDQLKDQSAVLSLWTFQANTAARSFYTRHAFTEVERTDGQGNDEHLPDIKYVWERQG